MSIQTRRDTTATNRWSAIQSLDSGGTARSLGLNTAGGNVGIGTAFPSVSLDISSTNAIKIPVGTTAQRPSAANGMMRLNTTTNQFEGYNNSVWQGLGGVIASTKIHMFQLRKLPTMTYCSFILRVREGSFNASGSFWYWNNFTVNIFRHRHYRRH